MIGSICSVSAPPPAGGAGVRATNQRRRVKAFLRSEKLFCSALYSIGSCFARKFKLTKSRPESVTADKLTATAAAAAKIKNRAQLGNGNGTVCIRSVRLRVCFGGRHLTVESSKSICLSVAWRYNCLSADRRTSCQQMIIIHQSCGCSAAKLLPQLAANSQ